VGGALRLLDCDVDLAPVVDLDRGRRDNALDDRCLGGTPRAVTARARAFLSGLHAAGVGGCLKHFPGLGGAGEDTHHGGSVVGLDVEVLADDLAPFAALAEAAGAVLVSHAVYPALSPALSSARGRGRPASLEPAISTRLLRRRLRFRGLAIADDLAMRALEAWGDLPEVAAQALAAGCDLLPVCHSLEAAPEVAARLARSSLRRRVEEAGARLGRYRRSLAALRRRHLRRDSLATVERRLRALSVGLDAARGKLVSGTPSP
jgi:beta-N-acetylhexosaminidase